VRILDAHQYERITNLGEITCLDVDEDLNVVIAGYTNGMIILFEISSKKSIKIVKDIYESPILQLKFWKTNQKKIYKVISSDSIGNVHELSF